jgi:methionyl aminopeptidase
MIRLKTRREIDAIRKGGRIVAEALGLVENLVQPGVTTAEVDRKVEELIRARGGRPAFKGHRGFPNCCCISINEQLVHGIPGPRVVKPGDIVSVDVGVELDRWFSDAAVTVSAGDPGEDAKRLMRVTKTSLDRAIAIVRPGVRLSEIGRAVQSHVESNGFGVVRAMVGHGIGRQLWEEPQVPNFWDDNSHVPDDRILERGTVIAIEPMVTMGDFEVETLSDHWTVVTRDRSLCAHYEHTVALTDAGVEVLTAP